MKTAWVQGQDENYHDLVKVGENLGFDIVGVVPDDSKLYLVYDADLVIVCNLHTFSLQQIMHIKYALFEIKIPYVKIEKNTSELIRPGFAMSLFNHSLQNMFIDETILDKYKESLEISGIINPLETEEQHYDFWKGIDQLMRKAAHDRR